MVCNNTSTEICAWRVLLGLVLLLQTLPLPIVRCLSPFILHLFIFIHLDIFYCKHMRMRCNFTNLFKFYSCNGQYEKTSSSSQNFTEKLNFVIVANRNQIILRYKSTKMRTLIAWKVHKSAHWIGRVSSANCILKSRIFLILTMLRQWHGGEQFIIIIYLDI